MTATKSLMPASSKLTSARLATRLAFLAAGFGTACWAPLVPFAKSRLHIDDATLGLLILCIGTGSVVMMPAAGALSARIGCKSVIFAGGLGMAIALPLLAVLHSPIAMAVALVVFGASLGSLDVSMNIHAVEVERFSARPLMSGFHAAFSIGGFSGSAFMILLLSQRLSPFHGALLGATVVLAAIAFATPLLLKARPEESGPAFVLPRGVVLLLALLAFVSFLVEGALLDWGALLLVTDKLVTAARGGVGYMLFSIAMTVGRLTGDRIVAVFGEQRVLLLGGLTALAGFGALLASHFAVIALSGFVLMGLGAANIVPILFRRAGNQDRMPPGLAIAAVSTAGYAGVLAGPGLVGFVAQSAGLHAAFVLLACLLALVPATSRFVARMR